MRTTYIVLIFVLIILVSLGFRLCFGRETFTSGETTAEFGKCTDVTPCDSAILATLMGCPSVGTTALKVYAPSAIHAEELKRLKTRVSEAAVASLRGAFSWAIFYAAPNFTGKAFLVPVGEDLTYYLEDGDGLVSTAALRDFVRDFGFHYGRRFSCVLPEGRKIVMTPVAGGGYPPEPVMLGPGTHPHVIYGKGPLLKFTVENSVVLGDL